MKTWNFDENLVVGNSKLEKWHIAKNHHFFIFCLYINEKWKKTWFFGVSQLIFDEKPLKNHDFWIFVVTKNAKIIIFDWFLCKICFLEFCPSSFLLKNQWKNKYFGFWKSQKLQKYWFFHGFLQKMEILTSQHLDGQKKKFSGMVQMVQKMSLTPFFHMPR